MLGVTIPVFKFTVPCTTDDVQGCLKQQAEMNGLHPRYIPFLTTCTICTRSMMMVDERTRKYVDTERSFRLPSAAAPKVICMVKVLASDSYKDEDAAHRI